MDIDFMSVVELKHMLDAKEVSIVEIIEHFYDRIDELNPKLNAVSYTHLTMPTICSL